MMRRLLAAAILTAATAGFVAQADPEPPVDHVYVQAGEGLWTVARRLCPHDTATVYVALQAANPWYTVGLHPGTVLHAPVDVCPPPPTTTSSTSTSSTTTTTTEPSAPAEFPTPETTGPRDVCTNPQVYNNAVTTSANGQVISCVVINGILTVRHSNVVVRDAVVFGIVVEVPSGGTPPRGVLVGYTEVNANRIPVDTNAVRLRSGTQVTLDHVDVHGCGRCVSITNDATITNSYLHAERTWTGAHREAIISNGPSSNNVIDHNTLYCSGPNCSSAMSIYGDFGVQDGWLIRDNLFATEGSYCLYAGSESFKPYPDASNIRIIGNHFSRLYAPNCGVFGYLTGFSTERGNEFTGNVWHETGEPIADR